MDNGKTGALIRELRKARNMTQKDLAERLHITDRAVSKWERGLCAPDISLLEPLAEILGCTVLELIEGRRAEHTPEQAETALAVMDYSRQEVIQQVSTARKSLLGHLALVLVLALLAGSLWLLHSGILFVEGRFSSPDGSTMITLYDRTFSNSGLGRFTLRKGASFVIDYADGTKSYITYGDAPCEGLWWAPDSSKYVVSLLKNGERWLVLDRLVGGSVSNLNVYLAMGVQASELKKSGYTLEYGDWGAPVIDYRFLQWGRDSQSMLIYYCFEDNGGQTHDGYFWYNCKTQEVSAILELTE